MNQSPNRVKRKMPEPFYRPTPTQASPLIQSSSSTPSVANDMPSSPSTTPNLVASQPNPKSRIIHHAHTNSLPMMMMPPQQTTTINATIIQHQHTYHHHHPAMNMPPQSTAVPSNNNAYASTNMNPYQTSMYNQSGPYYQYGSPSTSMINHVPPPQQQQHVYASPKPGSQTTETFGSPSIQAQHVKTYSLPVAFDGGGLGTVGNMPNLTATPSSSSSSMQPPPIRPFNSQGDIPLPPGWDFQQAPNGQIYYIK